MALMQDITIRYTDREKLLDEHNVNNQIQQLGT